MEQFPESRRSPIRFAPALLRVRHDGWTAGRQRRFIAALAATGSITRACAAVGVSRVSAYRLRARPEAKGFALAWQAAVAFDPAAPRRHSPRALQRLARMAAREGTGTAKGNEVNETNDPPNSFISEPLARHLRHLRNLRAAGIGVKYSPGP